MQSRRWIAVWLGIGAIAACDVPGDDLDPTTEDVAAINAAATSELVAPLKAPLDQLAQRAYIKASNTGAGDVFGYRVALSADRSTLAVGALGEASAATGVGGSQADESALGAGAVYVFTRRGKTWSQQAYLKASNTGAGDGFGASVALSADGSTLAVGAPGEASAATGIDGEQTDDSAPHAGAVYVFTRRGKTWSQQAYVKASNTDAYDGFGGSAALSADGSTLAVGAPFEAIYIGAIYVFTRSGTAWSQQAYVKAETPETHEFFGYGVALSTDGSTLAVGAPGDTSAATGISGDQASNSTAFAGAVHVLARSGTAWSQEAYVNASNADSFDGFSSSVALSADGSTLAVAAPREDSAAAGIGGDQADDSAMDAGAVYVFDRRR